MATAPLLRLILTHLSAIATLKDCALALSFKTIITILPSGVLNTTEGSVVAAECATRTDPAGINLETCAMI